MQSRNLHHRAYNQFGDPLSLDSTNPMRIAQFGIYTQK